MRTVSVRSTRTCPCPRQSGQGWAITLPRPLQRPQGRAMVKKPCWKATCPRPPHWVQVFTSSGRLAPDPLHVGPVSMRGMRTFVSRPRTASSKSISRS